MHDFDFLEPSGMAEASRMASELGEDVRFIAGGTALVLTLRQRMLRPSHLVSLAQLEDLRGIAFDAGRGLRIGALTRHAELAAHPLVQRHFPMLVSMASRLANPQVRNQGTLGGNLCYADPATDPPACLLALDASVVLVSARGRRELPLQDFLVDYYTTAIEPDELLQEIRVPPMTPDAKGAYSRHLRTAAEHRPVATVAVVLRTDDRVCTEARIVVGAAVPVARRLPQAEAVLRGGALVPTRVRECAETAAAEISALDDARGSADYRRAMVQVQLRRTLAGLSGFDGE
jgi:carbon-monoxide dehydrogenase medium subunit